MIVAALSIPSVSVYFATLELMKVYYPGGEGAWKVCYHVNLKLLFCSRFVLQVHF